MSNQTQQYISWFEKYRPKTIDELIFPNVLNGEKKGSKYIRDIFTKFYNQEFIQGNVLSYGEAGRGKTSLNKIMQGKIIKHPNDIFILGRKVEDIDKLKKWLQQSKVKSNQKLVIIEEIDRLSNQAQTVLKDGLLEKYQHNTSFLATTNNPDKLDRALVTRFNYRIYFDDFDVDEVLNRVKQILNNENIKYDENLLRQFVQLYIKRGLRELISNLEINSVTGEFIFDPKKALNLTGNEDYIIKTVVWLIAYLKKLDKDKVNSIISNVNNDQTFSQYYNYITKILKEDLLLNYDYIYKELIDSPYTDFMDKKILTDDYQKIDIVKMKNFWFLGTFSKIMEDIYKRKNLS
jgi:DNA polymerase III gamma/tau subunit